MTDTSSSRSTTDQAEGGFAVVEMFTSQGCNSCPPAEEVLSEIEQSARKRGRPVYTLGFHVDYWDHLGWPDPYADGAYTRRQEDYARAFGSGGLYTPQMIVNGTTDFVGSDRRQASEAIESALATAAITPLSLSVVEVGGDGARRLTVDYRVDRPPALGTMNVAVVEDGLENDVPRGENAGRRLRQDAVVRAFTSEPVDGDLGQVELTVPADLDHRRAMVIGYVQNDGHRAVVGAAVSTFAR
ncbi:DUF1223 domain-containing protein [Micromonospora andamanensis]|uniref:DUF1223 domain-containing protein n=1 Tax=Micromonospora andamanensis TaxID=1287068 RepID=UPI00194E583F|nr:DUF1223 domain-containing protein [Micromonospora andamanensis]GIJ40374.1 hypothetical protein Vwe01_36990 [Micromonospora andamanensis]